MFYIAVEQWRALKSLPVLTVPIASDVNDAVWKVSNAFYLGSLIKWVVDEGGETRTLYVCKSPGFVIKVR